MQSIYSPPGLSQTAYAVSANGSVIVGGSFGNAFRWTAATGGQQIPDMTFGWAVSADGSVVGATDVPGTAEVARIWTAECSTRRFAISCWLLAFQKSLDGNSDRFTA